MVLKVKRNKFTAKWCSNDVTSGSCSAMVNSFFFTVFNWFLKLNSAAFFCNLANLFSYLDTFFKLGLMLKECCGWCKRSRLDQVNSQLSPQIVDNDAQLIDLKRGTVFICDSIKCDSFAPDNPWFPPPSRCPTWPRQSCRSDRSTPCKWPWLALHWCDIDCHWLDGLQCLTNRHSSSPMTLADRNAPWWSCDESPTLAPAPLGRVEPHVSGSDSESTFTFIVIINGVFASPSVSSSSLVS